MSNVETLTDQAPSGSFQGEPDGELTPEATLMETDTSSAFSLRKLASSFFPEGGALRLVVIVIIAFLLLSYTVFR